jgi:hypothetical protein
VKRLLVAALCLAGLCPLHAQDQEGKLMNRLLRPNTALSNDAQNKKFTASDHATVDKHARVSTFYMAKKENPKTYSNTRSFSARQFDSQAFNTSGTGNSLLAARSTVTTGAYATPKARASVQLRDANKQSATGDYAGNRPYLEKGKSQKSLDRKNAPMTIEQVRELLNKS